MSEEYFKSICFLKGEDVFNSRTVIARAIFFYNSKTLNFIGALSFLRSVHTFMIFEFKLE